MKNTTKILIFSVENDKSTDEVITWLLYYNIDFVRINFENEIKIFIEFKNNKSYIVISNEHKNIKFSDIRRVWYRRGDLELINRKNKNLLNKQEIKIYKQYLENYYSREIKTIKKFINFKLNELPHINSFEDNTISKLNQLSVAQKCELTIPNTIIFNDFNRLLSFIDSSKNYILKALDFHIFYYSERECTYRVGYETSIKFNSENALTQISNFRKEKKEILYSLVQEYIEKKIEIRSFYLVDKFYSMAIFSQESERTKIDFRNYDLEKPNRITPFKLPKNVETKLHKLMTNLKLESGSIDLIMTPSDDFVFLEVNPVGHFDWLSKNCNYYIEQKIAKQLFKL